MILHDLRNGGSSQSQYCSILHRTRHDKKRPLLRTADPPEEIEDSNSSDPRIVEVALMIIETGQHNCKLVQTIVDTTPKPAHARSHGKIAANLVAEHQKRWKLKQVSVQDTGGRFEGDRRLS